MDNGIRLLRGWISKDYKIMSCKMFLCFRNGIYTNLQLKSYSQGHIFSDSSSCNIIYIVHVTLEIISYQKCPGLYIIAKSPYFFIFTSVHMISFLLDTMIWGKPTENQFFSICTSKISCH